MRIGGLASGIDTESIIKDLMKAERIPLDKVTQKKQYFEWQLDDYRSVSRDLFKYKDNLFDNYALGRNYNQKNVSVSDSDIVSIKSKSNNDDFTGSIVVKQLAKSATIQGNAIPDSENLKAGTFSVKTPDGKTQDIVVKQGDTVENVIKQISEKTGARAFYDSASGKIGLTSKQSGGVEGAAGQPSVEGFIELSEVDDSGVLESLGLSSIPTNQKTAGIHAIASYNGLDIERNSNTFDLDGLEVTLKTKSDKPVTFEVTTDTEKIYDKVKSFVDDYNKIIEDLNAKIREPKFRNFQPLSTEQKADMKEKEIELWEEKAKSGTLRNDPEISSLLNELRTMLTESVDIGNGQSISLSEIGITTSKNYLDHGKLVIDETKLKEAISKDSGAVAKLFSNTGETPGELGIAHRMKKTVETSQKTIKDNAGSAGASTKSFDLGRTLDNMNKQIERFEDRMKMVESRYWKQFNAMENAIQRANAQSASLMSALGGGA
ncbi:flagellar hook-associated protein 2 [Sporosarcina jeotgali]|uniref:Flagellar hook-associated protein 2 n=1 Tax=Sporosarcina jeotgali TaxID=3020056 RepID=A0ABZ0KYQ0_9BACL|nr:flagellar hook-associated protein 2 [Sporosarcina sp. B2O-1]WOV85037.1 flagellar hook-associated protein 2 [Sporosarcina sp. B2O-1]